MSSTEAVPETRMMPGDELSADDDTDAPSTPPRGALGVRNDATG